jgi:hypothetical protein
MGNNLCPFMQDEKYVLLKEGMEFSKTTKGFLSTTTETLFVQLIDFAPATKRYASLKLPSTP